MTGRGITRTLAIAAVLSATALAALAACGSAPGLAPGTKSVVSAPARVARTRLGPVGYRVVGHGPPLVLIMGYGWPMEGWDPRLVHVLARHHQVVMFDNTGVGKTASLPEPVTIDEMAGQASALISALRLRRPAVLGWSMGGTIAEALAVLHPAQVSRLVLCATYPGNGQAVAPSAAASQSRRDFPANQGTAAAAFRAAVAEYAHTPAVPAAAKTDQGLAESDWWVGHDPAGHLVAGISVPVLIADGRDDQIAPDANSRTLARLIPGSRLVLYSDAGHGFLFQDWSRFGALVNSFLAGRA